MIKLTRKANLSSSLRFMFVLLTGLVMIGRAEAATYTVTTTNESGAGSLRDAIGQANANPGADTINFAAGVTGTITLASLLPTITGDLTISGPGAGVLTVSGNSTVRVFNITSGVTASISGLTISSGNAENGGAINNDGTLTITSSTISGNSASSSGGAIANGIATEGTLTIIDSTLSGNSARAGGGIYNSAGALTIINTTMSDNHATINSGGAILNFGPLTITNSIFSGNTCTTFGGGGGGVANFATASSTVTDSTFSGNGATAGGGILNSGPLTIASTTFSYNSASNGAAVFNVRPLKVINSTFSGNSASINGGGIYNNFDTLAITGSTFSGNSAFAGGGVANNATATVKNSIIGNSLSGGSCSGSAPITAAGVNFSTDGTCLGFNQVTSAQLNLGPLQDNGGPTQTHALPEGSVAIDAVIDCTDLSANSVTTDQRGNHRPTDGDLDGVDSCDAGAFEAPTPVRVECIRGDAPTVSCPGDMTVTAASPGGAVVTYTAPVCLDCDCDHQTPIQIAGLASGSTFPVGTTLITYQVTDGGQTGTCSFSVTVAPLTCPLPQGYWKNNPGAWPVTSLTLGSAAYTKAELLAILNTPVGTGKNSDASLILAYQLIAAKLNVSNGVDPTPISATIAAADALLAPLSGTLPYRVKSSSAIGQQMIPLAAVLEQYNKSLLTPGCTP